MKKIILKLKNVKQKKMIIISAIILAVLIGGGFTYAKFGKKNIAASDLTPTTVTRGDISVTISGSGTVEPISRYEIISLVKGDILSCDYEEGDVVKEDDVLYRIDSTDIRNSIQKQHNNIEKTQITVRTNTDNIANLNVRAPASGTLTDFSVKVNDSVGTNKVGTIINSDSLIATVPFNSSQLSQIKIGDSATVTSALYMTTISGTVTHKSNVTTGSSDGSTLYDVEITLQNPGSFTSGVSVGATVHTSGGDVKSPVSGKIDNGDSTSVIPKVSGKVTQVYAKNNQYVKQGDILFQIDGKDYTQAQTRTNLELQDMQLSLQSLNKELENYNITSPIDGVVISKTYKTGDTIGSSQNSSAALMTVADTSQMVFNLDVDELEISKVTVGLTADITADALPNSTFTGVVSKVAKEGVSANGVTTYKVELTIQEPGELMSGMNVNAEIIVEQSENTLIVPISAVSNVKNNEGYVMVKADFEEQDASKGAEKQRPQGENNADGQRQRPTEGQAERPSGEGRERPDFAASQGGAAERGNNASGANTEYKRIKISVGLSDSENIEVLSVLSEGDEVFVAATASSKTTTTNYPGGGMGGGMGGGPPMHMR